MSPLSEHGDLFAEKRQHPRLPVKISVQYQSLQAKEKKTSSQGESQNLAVGGIAIRCEHPLRAGEDIQLDMFVPRVEKRGALNLLSACPENDCRKITVLAQVVWCAPFEDSRHVAGIKFLQLNQEDQEFLQAFLKEFKLPEPKQH